MTRLRDFFKKYFPLSAKGWLIYVAAMAVASALCWMLGHMTNSDTHVPMIFVLAVLVVALCTDGYFYGLLAAGSSVLGVNYAFTYPYLKLDFSIYGYPLTFMTMLAVGFAVSTLTTRLKAQEKLRAESEREKMRANLLRAVSHDLRTPLTAISGSIATVLEDGGEALTREQQRELLLDAKQDADWLCRMVENLLSITRISGAEISRINKQEEIVEEVLSEAVMSFRKRYSDVCVSVSVPEEMLLLPMDAMLIEQVIFDLMDNARTHGLGHHKNTALRPAGRQLRRHRGRRQRGGYCTGDPASSLRRQPAAQRPRHGRHHPLHGNRAQRLPQHCGSPRRTHPCGEPASRRGSV